MNNFWVYTLEFIKENQIKLAILGIVWASVWALFFIVMYYCHRKNNHEPDKSQYLS
jgi:hypothetical protein